MSDLSQFFDQFAIAWALIANTWWLWAPPLLCYIGWQFWLFYLRVRYVSNLAWVLLEVRIPRTIQKTPEAMEQIFFGLQTMYWDFDPLEKYWEGLQHDYIIFEMVSMGGDTRFYIRAPVFFRNVVEAQIYAQYPEAEVSEVEDYMGKLPRDVPSDEWDLFGVEFKLAKEDAYPLRTYRDIVALAPNQEEFTKVDPFASIAEMFGKTRPGEHVGFHILFRPTQEPSTDHWKKEGEKLVAKLTGKKVAPEKGWLGGLLEPAEPVLRGWGEPLRPLFGLGPGEVRPPQREEAGIGTSLMLHLSPGTRDIVAAIERNILKPGFECVVRFCYVARRDVFSLSQLSSFIGALKTYNTQTMNAFVLNSKSMPTQLPWWWPSPIKRWRKAYRKRLYYWYYQIRKPFRDTFSLRSAVIVLNTEELATIFHFPTMSAKAPMIPRIEARRSEPPATLPVG